MQSLSIHKNKLKINKYINIKDIIKEIESSKNIKYNIFDETSKTDNINSTKKEYNNVVNKTTNVINDKRKIIGKKRNHSILTSIKEDNNYFSNKVNYLQTEKVRIIPRQLSTQILPCTVITLNKKNGFKNRIILNNISNTNNNEVKRKYLKKCLSSSNNAKRKKSKLKIFDDFDKYLKGKTPLDTLIDKISLDYDIKLAHKKFSNDEALSKFFKKNFKNVRDSLWLDKYFYIKSKLNNTKSTENKLKNNEKALNFDNNKYKLFKNISTKIKNRIKFSAKKLDAKEIIDKIKKEENVENLAKANELKSVIEDENILLTPKDFLKKKKDPFITYKINKFVQKLNSNFTYNNRFILAKNFDIELEKYLRTKDKTKKL